MRNIYCLALSLLFISVSTSAQTVYDLNVATTLAKSNNKLILLDFTASWCGPCAKMETEFWNNGDYKSITDKFVIAKIDIDLERTIAAKYNVTSIPHIKVININGDELFGFLGYPGPSTIAKELKDFPGSVSGLYESMEFADAVKPNAEECMGAGAGLQGIAQTCTGNAKKIFLNESNAYFKKCKKLSKDEILTQQAALGMALNEVLGGNPKKALSDVNVNAVKPENKGLALYILAQANINLNDKDKAQHYVQQLQILNDDSWKPLITLLQKQL